MKSFLFIKIFTKKRINIKYFVNFLYFLLFFLAFISITSADIVTELNSKGDLYKKNGQNIEALDSYNQALNLDNSSISSWTGKADVLLILGLYSEALAAYNKIISLDPKNYWAYIGKGDTLKRLKKINEALLVYDSAIYLDSKIETGYVGKGNVLFNLQKYSDAIDAYDQAIRINPEDPWIWISKGDAQQKLKKYEEAIDSYDQAIKLKPDDPWIIAPKGDTLQLLSKYEDAIKIYDQALSVNPDEPWIWVSKGDALQQLRKYDDAVKAYDQAISLNPNEPWMWVSKGDTLQKLQRYEDAVKVYDQAISLNPKDSWIWYSKGNALKLINLTEEAIYAYNFALKLKPNFSEAGTNRDILLQNISKYENENIISEKTANIFKVNPTVFTEQQEPIKENSWLDSIIAIFFGKKLNQQLNLSNKTENTVFSNLSPELLFNINDTLIFSDKASNNLIIFNLNGTLSQIIKSNSSSGIFFEEITDITRDNNNNIYALDSVSKNIIKFDSIGKFIKSWQLYISEKNFIENPSGITFVENKNSNGYILVSETSKPYFFKFDTNGNFIGILELNLTYNNQIFSDKFYSTHLFEERINYQNITPDSNANPSTAERNFEIKSGNKNFPIQFILNRSDYLGSQENENIDFNINKENPEKWQPIITDALNDPITIKTIKETGELLDKIYHENQLSDSEYFDLITGFIQQIPLTDETNMRFPIEILHDKKGTSQDKALFLYSLLNQAGYDVQLLSFPGTSHCGVAVKTKSIGNPDSVTYYLENDDKYLYINPDKPDLVGRKSSSVGTSDPFLFKLLPNNLSSMKEIPESLNRIYIIETLTKIRKKQEFIEANINNFVSTAQRRPRQDLEKIRTVTQYVESQPWNTEGNLLRLKNSKVEDIVLNYGLK